MATRRERLPAQSAGSPRAAHPREPKRVNARMSTRAATIRTGAITTSERDASVSAIPMRTQHGEDQPGAEARKHYQGPQCRPVMTHQGLRSSDWRRLAARSRRGTTTSAARTTTAAVIDAPTTAPSWPAARYPIAAKNTTATTLEGTAVIQIAMRGGRAPLSSGVTQPSSEQTARRATRSALDSPTASALDVAP